MVQDKEKIKFLKNIYLFEGVSPRNLKLILNAIKENKFKKGDIIFIEGEKGKTLHIIKSGVVKIAKEDKNGKTKTLAILKEKDIFGEMAVLTHKERTATVFALTNVVTYSITKEKFEEIIKKEPTISLQIIKTLAERLSKADKHIKVLALGDAWAKLADILLELNKELKDINLTHQEIADLAGITRETTTRILSKWEKEGILNIKNKKITIKNINMLKEMCM